MKLLSKKTGEVFKVEAVCLSDSQLPRVRIPHERYTQIENSEVLQAAEAQMNQLPIKIARSEYRIVQVTYMMYDICMMLFRFTTWADVSENVLTNLKKNDVIPNAGEVTDVCFSTDPVYIEGETAAIDERADTPFNTLPDGAAIHVFAIKRPIGWRPIMVGFKEKA